MAPIGGVNVIGDQLDCIGAAFGVQIGVLCRGFGGAEQQRGKCRGVSWGLSLPFFFLGLSSANTAHKGSIRSSIRPTSSRTERDGWH
jgi:hypothetical protein